MVIEIIRRHDDLVFGVLWLSKKRGGEFVQSSILQKIQVAQITTTLRKIVSVTGIIPPPPQQPARAGGRSEQGRRGRTRRLRSPTPCPYRLPA